MYIFYRHICPLYIHLNYSKELFNPDHTPVNLYLNYFFMSYINHIYFHNTEKIAISLFFLIKNF